MIIRAMRSSAALAQGPRGNDKFNFGTFQIDPCRKCFAGNGLLVPLGPKVVHTLAVLGPWWVAPLLRQGQVGSE